ncbi:GDP-L-fucose synthase [Rhodoblastus acidophilus]|uniref:GDP-L-fucose synthase n=1 Tax=Rhodoblastus acidophilus TaxID=1074 RepID=UPI0022244E57|nr:GDP-L-fucose synthase [Rhodoblastus acidophilus]MCW2283830.1 GDP-L-fucose synthase [Rhodoblastus acidophilus]MCW2335632.1 GDP-L-fucose synthase [Rhodoblastus acidophilus]
MTDFVLEGRRVFVAGHRGMVGSACVRRLQRENCEVLVAGREEVDLTRQADVESWMERNKPDVVIVAAAKVGGILANDSFPAEFLYQNLMIESHLIHAAYKVGVAKLLFLGSSCIYPREAAQPIREDALLTGPLEKTNEWYAIAKIAGIKLCQAYRKQYGCDFISAMPCNLYGPGDNFHPTGSHVIPGLLRRFHEAKLAGAESVTCWGTGAPRREFLYVDDLADACVFLLKTYSESEHINVGTGDDITIKELAEEIRRVTGFEGSLVWDASKPDGTMLKRMDVSRLGELGWRASTPFTEGVRKAYDCFVGAQC